MQQGRLRVAVDALLSRDVDGKVAYDAGTGSGVGDPDSLLTMLTHPGRVLDVVSSTNSFVGVLAT